MKKIKHECYMKKTLFILKEQHNVECICVIHICIFFHKKEVKATYFSSAINKKLIRLVKIQICSEKKKLCCNDNYHLP